MSSSTTIIGSNVGRARRNMSQLWQVPTFLLGLLAFLAVAVSAPWRHPPQFWEFEKQVQILRDGLDQQRDGDQLVAQAEQTLLRLPMFPGRAGEVHFLAGSAYDRQAKQKPAAYAKALWPRAVEHLEKATALGVADADKFPLQYRLGYALYHQGRDVPRALELMASAVEKGAEQPLQGYQFLVQANLKLPTPNLDAALAASRRILDLTPERETEAIAQARLQHGEMLMRKDLYADASKELERIGAKASRAVRIKARQLQARCCEEDGLWTRAVPIWQELLEDAPLVEGGRARIHYAIGLCNYRMEPANYAETMRAWSEALKLGGAAGQAAGLRLGELRLSREDNESAQALADWQQALAKVTSPADFENPYIELAEVRKLFDRAIRHFQETQDAQRTQEVAELYRKIAPGGVAELRHAQAAEAYAQQLQDKKNVSAAEVQAQFRRAAEAYEQAAAAGSAGERPGLLWSCAQCALSAQDTAQAQKILHQHVLVEKNEARLADSWNTLGDLYRSQGKKEQARDAYNKCIEYPNTPFAFRARYFLAVEAIEQNNLEKARAILKQNLDGDQIEIDRPAQEKSLYKMAWLLMQMRNYSEGLVYLKDFLLNYPENQNALRAREQLGECYYRLAKNELAKEIELENQVRSSKDQDQRVQLEDARRHHHQTRMGRLGDAVKAYEELADDLEKRKKEKSLSTIEQILLRRALFGIGDCHLDGGNLVESLRVFQKLQLQHRQTLESFFACSRICSMVGIIQPSKLADQAKEMAKESVRALLEDLNAMPKAHEVFKTSDPALPTREAWLSWAEGTRGKLLAPPKTESPGPAFR